jgi:hypothetical protein
LFSKSQIWNLRKYFSKLGDRPFLKTILTRDQEKITGQRNVRNKTKGKKCENISRNNEQMWHHNYVRGLVLPVTALSLIGPEMSVARSEIKK